MMEKGYTPHRAADKAVMHKMRLAGTTLREIGEKFDLSRERVRKILSCNFGSAGHGLLTTHQLGLLAGISGCYVMQLYQQDVISPAFRWEIKGQHRFIWSGDAAKLARYFHRLYHRCAVCNSPIPQNKKTYCSDACRIERHKYVNLSPEEKKRVRANLRHYLEKKRMAAQLRNSSSPQ